LIRVLFPFVFVCVRSRSAKSGFPLPSVKAGRPERNLLTLFCESFAEIAQTMMLQVRSARTQKRAPRIPRDGCAARQKLITYA
jgi:hypothetical protein